ncbi:anti-repressor SinI family protein [Bacillus sp. FJAT-50079]|uniref:anti-repressor SinI family protein n=1 Tax=Bacillus sp. FJAT-50079 TaxID=2833577 RepID=UPI0032D57414
MANKEKMALTFNKLAIIGGGNVVKGVKNVDREWMLLILEAKQIGLTIEEIRAFLNQEKSG